MNKQILKKASRRATEYDSQQLLNMRNKTLSASLEGFNTQNHRMQAIGMVAKVDYVDNTIASNINATYFGMSNTYSPLIWITNASTEADYALIAQQFGSRIRGVVCLGSCHSSLRSSFASLCPIVESPNVESATYTAQRLAQPGYTVLLSPTAQTEDKQHLGQSFQKAVNEL